MPQGKFKSKALPGNLQKAKKKTAKNNVAFTRRSNAPIQPKKTKFTEHQKIKETISKAVNKHIEEELRSRAGDGKVKLSTAQKAVVKHHSSESTPVPASADTNENSN